jgi:RNA polymerase sigma-70 factor (ECF subfamily)
MEMENPGWLDEPIQRVQTGEFDAFEEVVHAFLTRIRSWVVARCPPAGDADEVVQLTFLDAFRRIREYAPGTDFEAWLFSIARYHLMTECTRLRRIADYHKRYAMHALTSELERRTIGDDPDCDTRLELMRHCLDKLDEKARIALDLRYQLGLPLEEISRRIGRTYSGVKKYLFIVRRQLHECVQRKLATEVD